MENRILRLTATQAARDFSRLLDRIASGEEVVIERHNQPVAVLRPPYGIPRSAAEALAIPWPGPSSRPDPDFAGDLQKIIDSRSTEKFDPWE
jgi:antitoxin (DNA-binding transcriptional repressor) of toxin-antitoxin stability system